MLILKQEDYNKIVDHAKKGLPNEACGLLGGYVEGDKRVVTAKWPEPVSGWPLSKSGYDYRFRYFGRRRHPV